MARPEPLLPKPHGKPRVDDKRVLSGIVSIKSKGLRWRDAPAAYGLHKTLYNRWKRWSNKGIFARMMAGLAAEHGEQKTVMRWNERHPGWSMTTWTCVISLATQPIGFVSISSASG